MKKHNKFLLGMLFTTLLTMSGVYFSPVVHQPERPESTARKAQATSFPINHLLL